MIGGVLGELVDDLGLARGIERQRPEARAHQRPEVTHGGTSRPG